jgi:predicted adenylyl cyclase CyaB
MNLEIKAMPENQDDIRRILRRDAKFIGIDHQIDTYFNVPFGRLKFREANIENYLIHYEREDKKGPKQSKIILYESDPKSSLKQILTQSLGILVVVDKQREIYFIDNVKFHIDRIRDLGKFIEIEAIDKIPSLGREKLLEQCDFYINLFGISFQDLISFSYSDLLLQKKGKG